MTGFLSTLDPAGFIVLVAFAGALLVLVATLYELARTVPR